MAVSTAANLKAELALRELTQRKVARGMGITYGYLSKLINGSQPWTRTLAVAFSAVTGIPLEAFYEGDA